jgi:hypothetical protein
MWHESRIGNRWELLGFRGRLDGATTLPAALPLGELPWFAPAITHLARHNDTAFVDYAQSYPFE